MHEIVIICNEYAIQNVCISEILYLSANNSATYILPIYFDINEINQYKRSIRQLCEEFSGLSSIKIENVQHKFLSCEWVKNMLQLLAENSIEKVTFCGDNSLFQNISYSLSKALQTNIRYYAITPVIIGGYISWSELTKKAQAHYSKKILLTGVECTGKTTLSKMLSIIFSTSRTYEYGRNYSLDKFGNHDIAYNLDDLYYIAYEQRKLEIEAIDTANKITFFDTDVVITQMFCKILTGEYDKRIELLFKKEYYDLILFLEPIENWQDDGIRIMNDMETRITNSEYLYNEYIKLGYKDKVQRISGNFSERLHLCTELVSNIVNQDIFIK